MKKPKRIYDFIIVCSQRSGPHLLASLLDSHPRIECDGEYGIVKDPLYKKKVNQNGLRGCIVMYNRFNKCDMIEPKMVIHLIRNSYKTARSRALNSQSKERLKRKHRAHRLAGEPPINYSKFEIDEEVVKRLASDIRANRRRVRTFMSKRSTKYTEVKYRDIVTDKDGHCPEKTAKELCKFLGVKPVPLKSQFVKGHGNTLKGKK